MFKQFNLIPNLNEIELEKVYEKAHTSSIVIINYLVKSPKLTQYIVKENTTKLYLVHNNSQELISEAEFNSAVNNNISTDIIEEIEYRLVDIVDGKRTTTQLSQFTYDNIYSKKILEPIIKTRYKFHHIPQAKIINMSLDFINTDSHLLVLNVEYEDELILPKYLLDIIVK